MRRSTFVFRAVVGAALIFTAAGDKYPDTFRSPLGIPISLSGNFGEMRANHFHTGLDIRTNGQTGYKVYASADGWVERIGVSPTWYGNALYLNHDNGYQSVYGHLEAFDASISDYVRSAQYARRSFAVDLAPERNRFRFAQGDVIAFSGNSGSSGGPHVHFEIRDAASAHPINPILFGIPVADTTPPRIHSIRVYPLAPDARVEVVGRGGRVVSRVGFGSSAGVQVAAGAGGRYSLTSGSVIRAFGRIGFGLSVNDYHEGSNGRLGVYRVRLDVDGVSVYRHELERLDFDLNRYLNAHVDYKLHQSANQWVQRSFLLPGNNRLPIYESVDKGMIEMRPGESRSLVYTVEDAMSNSVTLAFEVSGTGAGIPVEAPEASIRVAWNRDTHIERDGIDIRIPSGALYEDLDLVYSRSEPRAGAWSAVHDVHRPDVPLHTAMRIAIDASGLPERLRPRAVIARVRSKSAASSEGGRYENGFVTTETRSFGSFFIAADTTAPTIRALNLPAGASLTGVSAIRFRIADDFSGIRTYEGTVDSEWVLFAYDAKAAVLEHVFDGRVTRGRHVLDLRVTDGAGNTAHFSAPFTR